MEKKNYFLSGWKTFSQNELILYNFFSNQIYKKKWWKKYFFLIVFFFYLAIRQTEEINCLKSEDSKPLRPQGHIGYSTVNPGNSIFPYPSLPWPRPAAKHSPLPSIGLQPSLSSILLLLVGNRVSPHLGIFLFFDRKWLFISRFMQCMLHLTP